MSKMQWETESLEETEAEEGSRLKGIMKKGGSGLRVPRVR